MSSFGQMRILTTSEDATSMGKIEKLYSIKVKIILFLLTSLCSWLPSSVLRLSFCLSVNTLERIFNKVVLNLSLKNYVFFSLLLVTSRNAISSTVYHCSKLKNKTCISFIMNDVIYLKNIMIYIVTSLTCSFFGSLDSLTPFTVTTVAIDHSDLYFILLKRWKRWPHFFIVSDTAPNYVQHIFAISVFEDWLYWTDWELKSIVKANKYTGENIQKLYTVIYRPMDLHVYHPYRQLPCEFWP